MRHHILAILASAPARGIIVTVLRQEVGVRLRQRVGDTEWTDAVTTLKNKGLIEDGEQDTLTDDCTLKLTPAGRKAAAKL